MAFSTPANCSRNREALIDGVVGKRSSPSLCLGAVKVQSGVFSGIRLMTRCVRMALPAWMTALCFATGAGADIKVEVSIPDPAYAWQARDFAPVEVWLASEPGNAGEHGNNENSKSLPVLRAQAWLARREGAGARALALIDRAIELGPDRPDLRVDRAAFRSDQIEDSGPLKSLRIARDVRRDLEHALAISPEHTDALAALAAFHMRAPGIAGGDKQEAAALLARLGELAPSRRSFREAIDLADEERFAEAVDRIALALSQADRPMPNWQVRMGDWLHRLGRHDGALEAYREALSQAPQHTGAMYGFGRTAAESGISADAGIGALQRFLDLPRWPRDPETRFAWWQLGRIHARAGCAEKAEAAYRRALALDPDWRAPRRSLDQLADAGDPNGSCEPGTERPFEQAPLPAGKRSRG